MIIFDLKCENGHKFDGWFKDRQAFTKQNLQKLVSCPVCNSCSIEIVPSSVAIIGRDSRSTDKMQQDISPLHALRALHQYIDKNFDDVGKNFAEVALKIHYGEEENRNIRGTTTSQEEENLKEEGIQFIKIPIPKMDS
ncbi:MAG: DUF1178 family protein [Smithella sp.]